MSSRARIPRASDIVVDAIRNKILSERLAVGSRLPSETELMEAHGLGRVTVREALRLLERDGLVDVKRGPNGGIYVRHAEIRQVSEALTLLFSFRDTTIGEFLGFRMLVEPQVAALAAEHATDSQRARLLALAAEGLHVSSGSADVHSLVAEACGNDVFELTVKSLHMPLARHIRMERVTDTNLSLTEQAHSKIARCIAEGDAEGARWAMTRHLEAYGDYLRQTGLIDESIVPRQPWPVA